MEAVESAGMAYDLQLAKYEELIKNQPQKAFEEKAKV